MEIRFTQINQKQGLNFICVHLIFICGKNAFLWLCLRALRVFAVKFQ